MVDKKIVDYVANLARIEISPQEKDELAPQLSKILDYIDKLKELEVSNVEPTRGALTEENIFIDATGIGAGVYDRFRETGWNVRGINMAEAAVNKEKYINIRAEAYFRLREWIKKGGTLKKDTDFLQLNDIKYKMRSNGKLKIIDKDTLRRNGIPSPDVADALMLTFGREDDGISFANKNKIKMNRLKQPKYE